MEREKRNAAGIDQLKISLLASHVKNLAKIVEHIENWLEANAENNAEDIR